MSKEENSQKIILDKITAICNTEMNNAGSNEILMPTLQSAELWKESGRYEDYGKEMLRIIDRNQRDLLYGPTNEELVTEISSPNVNISVIAGAITKNVLITKEAE